ncbi:hypothetical protein ASE98_25260 [Pseudomonas sp. Leaf48]|uniref:winged helix-turn-helix domain-containing protein n=1 Tax=Pseudomonas sp. Leaf48 TaxID=1736221 RepID=UPI0007245F22|nr:winged helix-turn-helix domain-containing protein [Pseudomonas sp. Leaf48]KQN49088.1 hypothetical protein ASE98_25260 [Pseudomonas sp. Leaf48]
MGQLLIDEHLVFDESNFLLFRVDATDEEPLRLGAIASRCLAMILRSEGAVVRKRELMAGAWGQYGLEVTDNSLAQVVRQLRVALEKLQPDREFIQTLPRIGYKLADGVRVDELTTAQKTAAGAGSEVPHPEALTVLPMAEAQDEEVGHPSLINIPASEQPAPTQQPVLATARPRRWYLWLALPLWAIGAFMLGKIWLAPSQAVVLPTFNAPVTIDDVQVHLPAQEVPPLEAAELEPMVRHSRKLAGLLGVATQNLHLYLLPSRRGADQILCDGEMEASSSRCIGVQQHD